VTNCAGHLRQQYIYTLDSAGERIQQFEDIEEMKSIIYFLDRKYLLST
jgi:hypothetical protein